MVRGKPARKQTFTNLYFSSEEFRVHNYSDFSGLQKVDGLAHKVAETFRIRKPYRPEPDLFAALSFTLSSACWESFRRANPELPVSERDYYLSKLFQFLALASIDQSTDPSWHRESAEVLEDALDSAFPADFTEFSLLSDLDWQATFDAYEGESVEQIARRLQDFHPKAAESTGSCGTMAPQCTGAAIETPDETNWEDVKIRFLSDHRLEVLVEKQGETNTWVLNYAEAGFEDRRTNKALRSWACLIRFAKNEGVLTKPEKLTMETSKMEKDVQNLRLRLRGLFPRFLDNPIATSRRDRTYRTKFKISFPHSRLL